MRTRTALLATLAILVGTLLAPSPTSAAPDSRSLTTTTTTATPIQIYGAWHCGNDACTWATVRDMTNFDANNHWLIDRGDGHPSVNLVVLSFINPLRLLNQTTDSGDLNGLPRGMTSQIVSYFTSHGIRVMLSIGGITYTGDWDTALATNGAQLGGTPPRSLSNSASASRSIMRTAPHRTSPACRPSSTPTVRSCRTTPPARIPPRGSRSTSPPATGTSSR
jgi:hypothetical protein